MTAEHGGTKEPKIIAGQRAKTSLESYPKLLKALDVRVEKMLDKDGYRTTRTELINMLMSEFAISDSSEDSARLTRFRMAKESEIPFDSNF